MGLLWFEYQPPLPELHLRKGNGTVKMVNLQAVYSRASLYINIKCTRTVAGYTLIATENDRGTCGELKQ